MTLRCLSFHSVKGGVGKSTLATLCAVAAAQQNPEQRVVLIDMDLTGTSLADVLPLEAPCWAVPPSKIEDFLEKPISFYTRAKTTDALERRDDDHLVYTVPVLNDYLLFASPNWDSETDIPAESLLWRLAGGPENLRVIPSSALPIDLERTLPVIFDEEYSAYLESRLEYLLAGLIQAGFTWIIFDVPPTIPGLSRAVISLGIRLSGDAKQPLATDGMIPEPLGDTAIEWRSILVSTMDLQDQRAMGRWTDRVSESELPTFQVVLNRVPEGTPTGQIGRGWRHGKDKPFKREINPLLDDAEIIYEDEKFHIFTTEIGLDANASIHPEIEAILRLVDP